MVNGSVTSYPEQLCGFEVLFPSCTVPAAALPPGTYQVTASYSGDSNFGASASASHELTVSRAGSTTALALSQSKVAYGHEQAVQFGASVTSGASGPLTGTITITEAGTTLCGFTYPAADSCAIAATKLPAGTYQVTASYGRNTDFAASASAPQQLTIGRASSATTLALSESAVTYGHEEAERLTVTVRSKAAGSVGGKLTITAKAAHHATVVLCKITLKAGAGSCTPKPAALKAGKYSITAAFPGDLDFAPSTGPAKVLTVRK